MASLYLRKVQHSQAPNNYRVLLKTDHDGEITFTATSCLNLQLIATTRRLDELRLDLSWGIRLIRTSGGNAMRSNYNIALVLLAGVAIGAVAVQGLHAQGGAKLKAYAVAEFEPLDNSARAAGLPAVRKVIEAANGQSLRTTAGRVVQIEGGAGPQECGDHRMA